MCKGIGVNKKTERSAKRTENKREEKKRKKTPQINCRCIGRQDLTKLFKSLTLG